MKLLCALALTLTLVATTGCKTEVAATVECKVAEGPTVDCSITQTKGTAAIEVCWDFNVKCANDATLTASSCGNVEDGQTSKVMIPTTEITIEGACEGESAAEVVNVRLEAQ